MENENKVNLGLGMDSEYSDTAFNIFPEELWDLILDKLPTKDIRNVYAAYPEMEGVLKNRKHLWLFDQVLPFLAERLSEKDLLSCRLVSKLWSQGVDNLLENHPSNRAYNPGMTITATSGQRHLWKLRPRSPSPSFSFEPPQPAGNPGDSDPFLFLHGGYFQGGNSFHNLSTMEGFLDDWKDRLPGGRNPFVGRSIKINRFPWGGSLEYNELFWNQVLHILDIWGEHVWFVKVWENSGEDKICFLRFLQKALCRLPNLKSLNIEGNGEEEPISSRTDMYRILADFPELPHLETLKLDGCFPQLVDGLVKHYSSQIKRLYCFMRRGRDQPTNVKRPWDRFPNLSELGLVIQGGTSTQAVKDMLGSLGTPKLHRLHIHFRGNVNQLEEYQGAVRRVLNGLGGVPQLEHFQFHEEK